MLLGDVLTAIMAYLIMGSAYALTLFLASNIRTTTSKLFFISAVFLFPIYILFGIFADNVDRFFGGE